jgi:hypothetical protein
LKNEASSLVHGLEADAFHAPAQYVVCFAKRIKQVPPDIVRRCLTIQFKLLPKSSLRSLPSRIENVFDLLSCLKVAGDPLSL